MVPIAIAFYLAILPQHPVVTIGRRVMGAWILAVSLLIAAFHFKSLGNDPRGGKSALLPRKYLFAPAIIERTTAFALCEYFVSRFL